MQRASEIIGSRRPAGVPYASIPGRYPRPVTQAFSGRLAHTPPGARVVACGNSAGVRAVRVPMAGSPPAASASVTPCWLGLKRSGRSRPWPDQGRCFAGQPVSAGARRCCDVPGGSGVAKSSVAYVYQFEARGVRGAVGSGRCCSRLWDQISRWPGGERPSCRRSRQPAVPARRITGTAAEHLVSAASQYRSVCEAHGILAGSRRGLPRQRDGQEYPV